MDLGFQVPEVVADFIAQHLPGLVYPGPHFFDAGEMSLPGARLKQDRLVFSVEGEEFGFEAGGVPGVVSVLVDTRRGVFVVALCDATHEVMQFRSHARFEGLRVEGWTRLAGVCDALSLFIGNSIGVHSIFPLFEQAGVDPGEKRAEVGDHVEDACGLVCLGDRLRQCIVYLAQVSKQHTFDARHLVELYEVVER